MYSIIETKADKSEVRRARRAAAELFPQQWAAGKFRYFTTYSADHGATWTHEFRAVTTRTTTRMMIRPTEGWKP